MDALGSGILLGLTLSILTGPILFTLVQTSIEEGFRAGIAVASGIWVSDIVFVVCAYFGVSYITEMTNWQSFNLGMGMVGGLILVGIGLSLALAKPPAVDNLEKFGVRYSSYFKLWTTGFIINSANPFTFVFWFITTTAFVADFKQPNSDVFFYSGILSVIVLTDTLKVGMAKQIQKKMKPEFLGKLRRIAGFALVTFGVILMIRVAFDV
ncbi:MAG: threonine/homoserine/homoserine lactone efflux protein [Paraglaciecola sp.]|jgi:threonine/homoserine/homoserine lactone efflux protein